MKFNFNDYKLFCFITRQKPCRYSSLQDYRKYLDYVERLGI